MGDTGLVNGPQELPGPGIPKAMHGGGRRSATVMLLLSPHPEVEASVVV